MKRFHVHVSVQDLAQSTQFYSKMFGVAPTVEKPDYVKWMLDDPRINFAISTRSKGVGVNHLGLQADTEAELAEIHAKLQDAETAVFSEPSVDCCYAKSNKHWVTDPSGIPWESFHTLESVPVYGEARAVEVATPPAAQAQCGTSCRASDLPQALPSRQAECCNV